MLERRIQGAAAIYRGLGEAILIVTGGGGEAAVMRDGLLALGVPDGAILVEDTARDTLQSVRLCDVILRGRDDVNLVVPCTSNFHQPRCAVLLRALGWRVRRFHNPPDRPHVPSPTWLGYLAKEALATPYDLALIKLRRR